MQYKAKENISQKNHLKIIKVVDGDGVVVENIFNKSQFEIRLLGIDSPELKLCKKLYQDERETHLAAQLLMELGRMSLNYLLTIAPPNTEVSILVENNNEIDVYGRTLAYVFLNDGTCINEKMIIEGFAKPFNRYFCNELTKYQVLNLKAKNEQKGLFSISKNW